MRRSVVISFALLVTACREVDAQDLVSASSGVLQYFEGAVTVDDRPVEHKAAVFPSLKNGSTIRTEKGRAELLLTPGVYFRADENTSLRMVSNSLTDTRVELLDGTVILDNGSATSGSAPVLVFHGSEVRLPNAGIYRIDCDLGVLQVYSGAAEVANNGLVSSVDSSHLYYFSLELKTNKFGDGAMDEFYDWARNRSETIADQNQRAAAEQADVDPDPGASGVFVVPPLYSSPSYAAIAPLLGTSSYWSGVDPFYTYPPASFFNYELFPGVFVIAPYRHRPGGSKWPVTTGTAAGSPPGITKWPKPTQGITRVPPTVLHYPIAAGYRPVGTSMNRPSVPAVTYRPSVPAVTHVPAPSVPSHAIVPHMGGAGHR